MPETSKMYEHCRRVYDTMAEDTYNDGYGPIWRGFFVALVTKELGLPVPYYSLIKTMLENMGCIEQKQRGAGKNPSEWRLYFPPDPVLFDQMKYLETGQQRKHSRDTIEATLTAINTRLVAVEQLVNQLAREIRDDKGWSKSLP